MVLYFDFSPPILPWFFSEIFNEILKIFLLPKVHKKKNTYLFKMVYKMILVFNREQ